MTPEVRRELQQLLSALCDNQLTDAQQARLEELLNADSECRLHYLEYLDMHSQLLVHPGLGAAAASVPADSPIPSTAAYPSLPAFRSSGRRQIRQTLRYVAVAAATLAASLLVQVLWWHPARPDSSSGPPAPGPVKPPPGYVATLVQAAGCAWEDPKEPWRVGSRLPPGEMRLQKGIARVRFDSGADLMVEGPAVLRLESATAATVLRGKVVVRADEMAGQFELHTPSSTLVDLGTEYAVAVGPEGEEVHVFDGEVQRTPRAPTAGAGSEHLTAGEARRYAGPPAAPGQPTPLAPERFVRALTEPAPPPADPAAGLLLYEGFDYHDPADLPNGRAAGGLGWAGAWRPGFARPLNEGDENRLALNVNEGLSRPGAAVPAIGGSFDYAGFAKYFRRMATPVRLDTDGVYYLSFLFRRDGPPADPLSAVAVLLRTDEELERELNGEGDQRLRLNIGVDRTNHLFTHLHRVGIQTPLPMSYGETYLLVAKIVASGSNPDQVFMRVYGPAEPVEPGEPASWSAVGPLFHSDLVFDWLQIHINSKKRQTMDEIRLGTTWSSVTAPWIGMPGAKHR